VHRANTLPGQRVRNNWDDHWKTQNPPPGDRRDGADGDDGDGDGDDADGHDADADGDDADADGDDADADGDDGRPDGRLDGRNVRQTQAGITPDHQGTSWIPAHHDRRDGGTIPSIHGESPARGARSAPGTDGEGARARFGGAASGVLHPPIRVRARSARRAAAIPRRPAQASQ